MNRFNSLKSVQHFDDIVLIKKKEKEKIEQKKCSVYNFSELVQHCKKN